MRISDWSSDVCSSDLPEWDAPFLQEWNDPTWTHWTFDDLGKIDVHPQEIVDNITDAAHFGPVHGSKTKFFENEFAGHLAIQRMVGGHRTLVADGGPMLVTEAVYHGQIGRATGREGGVSKCRPRGAPFH